MVEVDTKNVARTHIDLQEARANSNNDQIDTNHLNQQHQHHHHTGTANFKTLNYDKSDIKPTKKRYLILLLFCLHSMINAAQWIYLSSITNIVSRYYRVDNMAVNWTSMVYMLVYIPLIVPASWLFERIGMRDAILLGSIGTTLGSFVKLFSCQPDRFYLLMTGQTIVAISQLFVLSVPPRLASVWFPDDQVSLATACGVFGNQFGIALGFVVPSLVIGANEMDSLVSIEESLFNLFLGVVSISTITSLLILFFFDKTPSKAPGLARLQQIKQENAAIAEAAGTTPLVLDNNSLKYGFGALLWDLITEKNFVMLIISYGLNVGVFYAISTILNQMILRDWPDGNKLVGQLGLVLIIAGMFGSVIAGYILDKTHMYRLVNASLYASSLVSMILFAITLQLHNLVALYLTIALLGYFMTGYLMIGYEMSNEITWPRPESVSAGLLNLAAQVSRFITS